jgi:hypothetical protein
MEEKFAKDLKDALGLFTDILVDKKRPPETITAFYTDVRCFLVW